MNLRENTSNITSSYPIIYEKQCLFHKTNKSKVEIVLIYDCVHEKLIKYKLIMFIYGILINSKKSERNKT